MYEMEEKLARADKTFYEESEAYGGWGERKESRSH